MLTLQNITLQRGKKLLLEQASVTVFAKQKAAVVGVNGSGKSSLFSLLLKKISPDGGDVFVQSGIRVAHLSQEVPNTGISALQYAMEGDVELSLLMRRLKKAEEEKDGHLITELHNLLYENGGYNLEARAAKLLVGLGFKLNEQQNPVNSFSGGWRMRLNLAQVLMSRADLLLLDEPTNYLDMDAIVWLERWLQNYEGTLLLISHDRDFLDEVAQKIIYLGNKKLDLYAGNYSSFEKQRAEKLLQERSLYEKQQKKIDHLNKFVSRFRAKASKARQAQSRLKMIEKMEKVSITQVDSPFSFEFYQSNSCGAPLISIDEGDVSYGEHKVLSGVNFSLDPHDSIGILGINGAGKSTFMKTLAGALKTSAGEVFYNKGLKVGYFAQHQVDQLDMEGTPIEHICRLGSNAREQQVRAFLGGFGFQGDMAFQSIADFSGGEKARLVLALLIWQKPNLLLLDEPTNHLDLEMRLALTYALQDYDGALVLVAHDRHLLKSVVDRFYLVDGGKVERFDGDLDDYQKWILDERKRQAAVVTSAPKKTEKKINVDQKQLRSLEREIEKLSAEKKQLVELLSDPVIYQGENKMELEKHVKRSAVLEKKIKVLEERLLELYG